MKMNNVEDDSRNWKWQIFYYLLGVIPRRLRRM